MRFFVYHLCFTHVFDFTRYLTYVDHVAFEHVLSILRVVGFTDVTHFTHASLYFSMTCIADFTQLLRVIWYSYTSSYHFTFDTYLHIDGLIYFT